VERQSRRPAEQSKAWILNKLSEVNEMKISCVIWLNVYLTMIFPVIRGWIEQK
jgi:hypothetical protein